MGRKPDHALLILADGGRKKGGDTYGSFQIGGYPDEDPLTVSRIALRESTTSTQAEAEILAEAVAVAVDGMIARELNPARWLIQIESDSLSLITALMTRTDTELDQHLSDVQSEAEASHLRFTSKEISQKECKRLQARAVSIACVVRYIKRIRKLVEPFGEVRYRHVRRAVTVKAFGH